MGQSTITTTKTVARGALRGLGYITAYFVFGIFTSAVAALFGLFFLFLVGMGWSGGLAVVFNPFIPIFGFPIGFMLSMPVTFIVLPGLTLLLKHRPATHLFALAVCGAVTGGWITSVWVGHTSRFSSIATEFVTAGIAAGLVAGMMYAAMVRATQN